MIKRFIVGGLAALLSLADPSKAQNTNQFSRSVMWLGDDKQSAYWIFQGDNILSPFLRNGEPYVLREFRGNAIVGQNYVRGERIKLGKEEFALKNIGKIQPHSAEATYRLALEAKNSRANQLDFHVELSGNKHFHDLYEDLRVKPAPYTFGTKSVEIDETPWTTNSLGEFKKQIDFSGNEIRFVSTSNLPGTVIFSIGPLSLNSFEQKKKSKEMQRLIRESPSKYQEVK